MLYKNVEVPTGNICIMQGEKGLIEFLSIGDYGKEANVKADFMGLNKEINGVSGDIMPLEKKWVITVSTQYGCSMGCAFCDVPKVGRGKNASYFDLVNQIKSGIKLHPEVSNTDRLNIHFARMGEPTFNKDVLTAAITLREEVRMCYLSCKTLHPVVSTMMPKNNGHLFNFIKNWINIKNKIYFGEAGLQISVNTTDEIVRNKIMPYSLPLRNISNLLNDVLAFLDYEIIGRKIALNFAITGADVDAKLIRDLFDPEYFMCKITPMHITKACRDNQLMTKDGYEHYHPYKKVEKALKDEGFDVLVFIPSKEEDESRITCGNAILSDIERT